MTDFSYFPGCSMATSAKESNISLLRTVAKLGLNLVELEDWNCCGSSSAHSVNHELAFGLAVRNLSLAPKGRPLLAMCPSCLHRLTAARRQLRLDPELRTRQEQLAGRSVNPDLEIVHLFDVLDGIGVPKLKKAAVVNLGKLKFVPYYGCMLAKPPALRHEKSHHGLMEKLLSAFGATPLPWGHSARCCGTFLAAARPDIATRQVNEIIGGAQQARADCIVTSCAMCQLNLEIRCTLKNDIPTFHFSEIMAMVLGENDFEGWFRRHLVDPMPVLERKGLAG